MKFSTKDKDNNQCAALRGGAWWYNNCQYANLNGQYLTAGERSDSGINWYHWKNDRRSMKKTEIKTRPA
jgi:hypothetical protein